jgi:predicted nucleic acid-binding protein
MIFIDSCYFIGLVEKNDQWHKKAVSLLDHFKNETVVISEYVLSEVITEVGKRSGGKKANTVFNYFLENCHIVYSNPDMILQTERIFLKYDGTISFVDAMSLRIMENYQIKKIISFDSDFDKIKGIERIY